MALNPVSIAAAMALNINKLSDYTRPWVAPQCDVTKRFSIVDTSSNRASGRYLKRMPQNAQGVAANTPVIQAAVMQQATQIGMSWQEVDHTIDCWNVAIPVGIGAIESGDVIGLGEIEKYAVETLSENNQVYLEERCYAALNGSWTTTTTGGASGYINDPNFNFPQFLRNFAITIKQAPNGAYPNTLVVSDDVLTYISQNGPFLSQFGLNPFAGSPQETMGMLSKMLASNGNTSMPFNVVVGRAVHQTSADNAASNTVTNGLIIPSGFAWLGYVAADESGKIQESCDLRDNSALKTIVARDYQVRVNEVVGAAGTQLINAFCNRDVVITNPGAAGKITSWVSA